MRDEAVTKALSVAAALALPTPFTVSALLVQLEHARNRPIKIHAVDPGWGAASGWCGAWIEAPDADHIVYVEDLRSTSRKAGTILHEVGHMLLDHPGAPLPAGVNLATIGLTAATRIRGRAQFASPEERAAETFSTLILQAAVAQGMTPTVDDPHLARVRRRLS